MKQGSPCEFVTQYPPIPVKSAVPNVASNHPLRMQRKLRRWHRLVALVTSCQLLLWTLSGLYFAFIDIDHVRGHQFKRSSPPTQLDLSKLTAGLVSANKVFIQERLAGELIVGVRQMTECSGWMSRVSPSQR